MWDEIVRFIHAHESFLITTHINPDGDAIGCEIALKSFLEDLDKQVLVANSSENPSTTRFLDPDGEILVYPSQVTGKFLDAVDAVFILDVNNWEHTGGITLGSPESTMFLEAV